MLDRFVPVAGMLQAEEHVSRRRMLEDQHRADLRLAVPRPSFVRRLASGAADNVRHLFAPAPAVCTDPAC